MRDRLDAIIKAASADLVEPKGNRGMTVGEPKIYNENRRAYRRECPKQVVAAMAKALVHIFETGEIREAQSCLDTALKGAS